MRGPDVVMTDSMRYCDVVLPAASHFEHADIYASYGHCHLQRAEPVIPRVGESLPNTEIFRRLAVRFGFDDPMFHESDEALMDVAFLDDDPRLGGHRPSCLPVGSSLAMTTVEGAAPVMCDTVAPATGSGRVELFSRDLEDRFGYGLPRYEPVERGLPFTIISPSSPRRINATFGHCALSGEREEVEINPADAERRGISDGDLLRVFNDRGETHLVARVTDAVLPGVLYTPKGVWLSASPTGQTVNALLDADIRTDIEDGACCNEAFCDIASAGVAGGMVDTSTPWGRTEPGHPRGSEKHIFVASKSPIDRIATCQSNPESRRVQVWTPDSSDSSDHCGVSRDAPYRREIERTSRIGEVCGPGRIGRSAAVDRCDGPGATVVASAERSNLAVESQGSGV